MGLFDMVMIKDNHISAAGGIPQAIDAAIKYLSEKGLKGKVKIEVETSTLEEVKTAMKCGEDKIHRIMRDNMVKFDKEKGTVDTSLLKDALQLIQGKYETEASGNINIHSVAEVAKTNVQFVSTGSVTHSVTALDISLKFE